MTQFNHKSSEICCCCFCKWIQTSQSGALPPAVPTSTSKESIVDNTEDPSNRTNSEFQYAHSAPAHSEPHPSVPLAVIGWSHKFPGDAETSDGFWKMLCEGRTAHGDVPKDRFNVDAFYQPNAKTSGTMSVKTGHFLKQNIAAFDAPFFAIQPAEAAAMDPQQRMLLETSYHAFENAGLTIHSLSDSKTSVFVGACSHDYECMHARDPEVGSPYLATGVGSSLLANRISWFFNLHGESMLIDTACSSSLTCLHQAARSLQAKDCDIALVGGVNIIITPDVSFFHNSNMGFLSPDGHSYSFDERANGYAKGEGVAALILKRLDDAILDGDTIRAIIGATGANQDGRTPGLTQPSAKAQEMNMRTVHERYGISPDEIHYIEAHGTGTQIGDPIECAAIAQTFQRKADNPLIVGAVKPNIGHLEAVAGLAALIKVVMALEKGLIPPNALYRSPNPRINAEEWNLKFPQQLTTWPVKGLRTAAISSFGYGGSNAYAILHDALHFLKRCGINGRHNSVSYPVEVKQMNGSTAHICPIRKEPTRYIPKLGPRIFLWSGADEISVRKLMKEYGEHLDSARVQEHDESSYLHDLSFSLSTRRTLLPWKAFIVAQSVQALKASLESETINPIKCLSTPFLTFVFTGQGAQWFAMARELINVSKFAESLQKAEVVLLRLGSGFSATEELLKDESSSRLDDPLLAQTLCTVLQLALVDLLAYLSIRPEAVIGHSSGEIAAAYCAGGISFGSAVKIAFYRGYYANWLVRERRSRCGMVSIQLSAEEIQPYIDDTLSACGEVLQIACINSPVNVTLSGDDSCIDFICERVTQNGIFSRRLQVPLAYHSRQMEQISAAYGASLVGIETGESEQNDVSHNHPVMFSTVTGTKVSIACLAVSTYWVKNMTSTVEFSLGMRNLVEYALSDTSNGLSSPQVQVLEIGPHSALRRPVKDILSAIPRAKNVFYDSILERHSSTSRSFLQAVGRLRCNGVAVDVHKANELMNGSSNAKMVVDLPRYPFNHSVKHWSEPRISKEYRFRPVARHELLGVPSTDWNPLQPCWRHELKVAENPWILDHHVDAAHIYPAAGMIAMVIEAARQLTSTSDNVTGFHLTNVRFVQALKINDSNEGVAVQLHFQRPKGTIGPSYEHDFTIFTYTDQEWRQCSSGTIQVEFANQQDALPHLTTESQDMIEILTQNDSQSLSCTKLIAEGKFYENLAEYGYGFGPTHQTLQNIRYSKDSKEACGQIYLDNWTKVCETQPLSTTSHVIHPTDLDGVVQLTLAAIAKGGEQSIPTMVPTGCKSLWFSNKLLRRKPGSELHAMVRNSFTGLREADYTVLALNEHNEPMITMDEWRIMAVTTLDTSSSNQEEMKRFCYTTRWDYDLDQLSTSDMQFICNIESCKGTSTCFDTNLFEFLSMYYVSRVIGLAETQNQLAGFGAHTTKYVDWANRIYDKVRFQEMMPLIPQCCEKLQHETTWDAFLDSISSASIEYRLTVHVGKCLEGLMRGELDPLEIVYDQELIREFYQGPSFQRSFNQIKNYIKLFAHKYPNSKILEIGAGTGSGTIPILSALVPAVESDASPGLPKFEQYDFTDVSPQYFEHARHLFAPYVHRFKFQILNIEQDPVAQGFKEGVYDLVYAGLVLHATSDISRSLRNARKLLKPGGKLILLEITNLECARNHFIFGLLPGWWLGTEEARRLGPLLTQSQWDSALRENGFSGADISMADTNEPSESTFHVMVATASETSVLDTGSPEPPLVVIDSSSTLQKDLSQSILSKLQVSNDREIVDFTDISLSVCTARHCIVLVELDRSWLRTISEPNFRRLQALLGKATKILWVTCGNGNEVSRSDQNLITGLGRSLRSENWMTSFTHLALDNVGSLQNAAKLASSIYIKNCSQSVEKCEDVYQLKDGQLRIGRVCEANILNRLIWKRTSQQQPQATTFEAQRQRNLILSIATPGLLDTLHFVDDVSSSQALGDQDIEIYPAAVGLNFRDIFVALGKLSGKNLGVEFSGTVSRVGATSEFQPGDRVLGMTPEGGFKTRIRAHAGTVIKMDNKFSFEEAAAMPVAWSTAYYCLVTKAGLQADESVLIHSGAGGVGQAAVQIAQHIGARVFITVGTDEKKQYMTATYGIPESHIFSSRTTDFADCIMKTTGGNGVDVILNSLSGNLMRASLSVIAPLGRFVEIGKTELMSTRGFQLQELLKNVSFIGVDLITLMQKAPAVIKKTLNAVMELHKSGALDISRPLQIFPASEMEQAFRWMQGGTGIGKAVVTFDSSTMILAVPSRHGSYMFSSNSTYVIAGGFGGIGGAILKWMISRGAQHFLVLSRSGQKSENARKLLAEIATDNINIIGPCCDIADKAQVQSIIEQAKLEMPPIQGCIQATTVLQDGLFLNLTYNAWNNAIRPKVEGTWNLHKHLPKGMDFFVALSSAASVIGARGQANYAAGNAYQDSLAQYRQSIGERACSLNIGPIRSVGIVAETGNEQELLRDGCESMAIEELLALLDYVCDPAQDQLDQSVIQNGIITGLGGIRNPKAKQKGEIFWLNRPFTSCLNNYYTDNQDTNLDHAQTSSNNKAHIGAQLKLHAESDSAAIGIIFEALQLKLSRVLDISIDNVDASSPVHAFGVDSLVSLEIRYWFLKEIKANLAVFDIMGAKSLIVLCELAWLRSEYKTVNTKPELEPESGTE